MKITTEIDGKNYVFELDRATYKNLLQDKEYAKLQDELVKQVDSKGNFTQDDSNSTLMLQSLIITEKVFHYSLLKNQPNMTMAQSSELLDKMIDEDGSMEGAIEITQELIKSFIEGTTDKKKKKRTFIKG